MKLIKTCLKLKRDQRKNFTQKNCGSLKVIARKTWSVMKEILEKRTTKSSTLPTKTIFNKIDIFDEKKNSR